MNKISFGAKIPVAICQIKNKNTQQMRKAVIYEYDCKDISDYWALAKIEKEQKWKYADIIAAKADLKCNGRMLQDESIYSLEDESGKTVGLCNFRETSRNTEVRYIESKSDDVYKYVGQNMLALLAKRAFYSGKKEIRIANAQHNAFMFYKKCCFQFDWDEFSNGYNEFYLKREKMPTSIKETEDKTNTSIKEM